MMKNKTNILLSTSIIMLAIAIGLNMYNSTGMKINDNEIEDCYNLSLKESSKCMVKYVKTFYNYTPRNENFYFGDDGSLEDVKLNGGDCTDYSRIYVELARELGFYARTETIHDKFHPTKGGHQFVIMWDKDINGYCILDNTKSTCTTLL